MPLALRVRRGADNATFMHPSRDRQTSERDGKACHEGEEAFFIGESLVLPWEAASSRLPRHGIVAP